MSEKTVSRLISQNITISFMESCTGGLLASLFTDVSGASAVFTGSLVTYSNQQKIRAGVDPFVIEKYGVYSAQTAREMARTCQKIYKTRVSVGITGTTGNPDPANPGSILGEAFFCIIFDGKEEDFHIQKDVEKMSRPEIKEFFARSVYDALDKMTGEFE